MLSTRETTLLARAQCSQTDLCVVLENVTDIHNVGAVMRSCDAVGVRDLHLIHTFPELLNRKELHGFKSASNSQQWVRIHVWHNHQACFERLRQMFVHILATHLNTEARSLYELDLVQPTALVFGNEQQGISAEALSYCTGNFVIPMQGFTQSLNISVACAVSLYEAQRQRYLAGRYTDQPAATEADVAALMEHWTQPRLKKVPDVPKVWPVVRKARSK
jgi:tRNA (guanosine-2'-O-)-methyltransferase